MGLDVSGLTDAQMSDNHGWVWFPNFFMTIRAGEAHIIMSLPHPDGDPNRCIWHVASYMWLPDEAKAAFTASPIVVDEAGSYKYFEALQQDYEQMPRQQIGLRNTALEHMALVKGRSRHRALPFGHRQVPRIGRRPLLIHPVSKMTTEEDFSLKYTSVRSSTITPAGAARRCGTRSPPSGSWTPPSNPVSGSKAGPRWRSWSPSMSSNGWATSKK